MLAFNLSAFFTYLKLMKAVGDFKLPDLNIPFVLEDGLENDVETFLGTDRLVTHSNPQTLPFSDSLSNLDSLKMKEIPYAQENPVQPLTSTTDKLSVSASIFRHNAPDHSIPDTGAFERKNHPMNYVYFTESARLHKSPKKIQRLLNPELTSKKSKQSINNEAIINLNNEASTIEANILGQGINLPKKGSNIFTSLSKPDFLSISMNNLLKSLQKIPADLIARSLEHPSQKFSRLLHFFFFNPLQLRIGQDGFLAGNGFPHNFLPTLTEFVEVVSVEIIIALDSLFNSVSHNKLKYLRIRELSKFILSNKDSLIKVVKTQDQMHLRIEMRKVFNGALMEPTPVTVKQINERKVRDTEICEYPYHYIVNFWKLKMVPKFFQGNIEEKLHLYASEKVFKRNLGYIPPSGRRKLAISADFMRDEIKKESEKIHQNNKYLEINNQIMNQELAIEHEITSSTGNKLKCYRFSDLSNSPIAGFIYLIKVFHRYLEDEKMRSKTEEEIEKECWVFIEKFKNVRSSETLPHTLFEGNKNNRVYIEKGKDIWISIIKKVRISTDNSRFMVTGAWMLLKLFFLGDHRLSSIMYPERYMEYKFHFTTLLNEAAYFESLKKHIFPSS